MVEKIWNQCGDCRKLDPAPRKISSYISRWLGYCYELDKNIYSTNQSRCPFYCSKYKERDETKCSKCELRFKCWTKE